MGGRTWQLRAQHSRGGRGLLPDTDWHGALERVPHWFAPPVLGNICGGVGMVTLLEYGQVVVGRDAEAEAIPAAEKNELKKEGNEEKMAA